jgi:predicted nucleotidyltransferase
VPAAEREKLRRAVGVLSAVLGGDALAAYLYGSATRGGLRVASDLDVLAVARRRTTLEERRRLADGLRTLLARNAAAGDARRNVELAIVVRDDVVPWRYPPRLDFLYGSWLDDAFRVGDLAPWSADDDADLTVLLAMALETGEPLLGPPAAALLAPVPRADLVRACLDGIDWFHDKLESDTRNILLTLARIWLTVETGSIAAKDAAADFALARLSPEHRAVLVHARAVYRGEAAEDWGGLGPAVRPCAERLVTEIRRAAVRS